MGGGRKGMGAMFKLSAAEIHLPQLLNEEAIRSEERRVGKECRL